MFSMAIMLAVMSTGVEMYLVTQYEWLEHLMIKYKKMGIWVSFILSFILGTVFGMEGLVTGFAAIMSTIMSVVIYQSGLLKYAEQGKRAEIAAKTKKFFNELFGIVRSTWNIIVAPYRFCQYVRRQWIKGASEASDRYQRAKRALHRA